ncbi:uncharacterized protein FIBRA_07919 [Fibroporia radiculosa]|uniref:C2H2-type domain-containing protein n=1 Tax=Fibroporia radiculosa TaxID=599839 RepID=J4GFX5_9APHY|nr:uncharacterized protein FIBRA_07919 [Fibroporia radiculosa]CCM05688.1 predicted protein [Fibroporia radiculosa]
MLAPVPVPVPVANAPLADPQTSLSVAEIAEELKRDTTSRMRNHRGNVPSVPQTKTCPLCPAKFTRTTHLSRHLRTHTREKLHECDGQRDPLPAQILSVMCRLQGATSSRVKAQSVKTGDRLSKVDDLEADLLAILAAHPPTAAARGQDRLMSPSTLPRDYLESLRASLARDPRSPAADFGGSLPSRGSVDFSIASSSMFAQIDQTPLPPQGNSMFANDIFHGLMDNVFAPSQMMFPPTSSACHKAVPLEGEWGAMNSAFNSDFSFHIGPTTAAPIPEEVFQIPTPVTVPSSSSGSETAGVSDASSPATTTTVAHGGPSPVELQTYLGLFFSAYLPNMPIIHAPTFDLDKGSPILLVAMQACGALYVKTRTAISFIDSALARARDELVVEFAKASTDLQHQICLALAVDLFQTLGLFHQSPEQRAFSNVYHGMLAMMIRLNGFAERISTWESPDNIDPSNAYQSWREWAMHETAKRALAVSYLHDCCHSIYFNLRPTYITSEFDMRLPCENALWSASTEEEWLAILRQPSPYGTTSQRLCGPPLQASYARLADPSGSLSPLVLSPWSHNIVIHMILRQLFEDFLEARLPELGTQNALSGSSKNYISPEKILSLQLTLHQWLQSWRSSPDSPRYSELEPRFMDQALPYYWLAQVGILAYQERLPPFSAKTTFLVSGDAKFRLMKKWERHIRNFLKRGAREPTLFLDELVAHRLKKWEADACDGVDDEEDEGINLLGFFPAF